jgi:ABC-type sulfate transport system permease subunit
MPAAQLGVLPPPSGLCRLCATTALVSAKLVSSSLCINTLLSWFILCCWLQVLLLSLLDLPFSISPVVTGLMLMLLYGRAGWFATALADSGLKVVFAFTGEGRAAAGLLLYIAIGVTILLDW